MTTFKINSKSKCCFSFILNIGLSLFLLRNNDVFRCPLSVNPIEAADESGDSADIIYPVEGILRIELKDDFENNLHMTEYYVEQEDGDYIRLDDNIDLSHAQEGDKILVEENHNLVQTTSTENLSTQDIFVVLTKRAEGSLGGVATALDIELYDRQGNLQRCAFEGNILYRLPGYIGPSTIQHEQGHSFGMGEGDSLDCVNNDFQCSFCDVRNLTDGCRTGNCIQYAYGEAHDSMGTGNGDSPFNAVGTYGAGWFNSQKLSRKN